MSSQESSCTEELPRWGTTSVTAAVATSGYVLMTNTSSMWKHRQYTRPWATATALAVATSLRPTPVALTPALPLAPELMLDTLRNMFSQKLAADPLGP
mmetsp:Transcript_48825/g.86987  ORF Transcript_48825/g.86987 Transcript_48825/m.86987 type:complete len:98 (-) Transcript_48825:3044-3337(-)